MLHETSIEANLKTARPKSIWLAVCTTFCYAPSVVTCYAPNKNAWQSGFSWPCTMFMSLCCLCMQRVAMAQWMKQFENKTTLMKKSTKLCRVKDSCSVWHFMCLNFGRLITQAFLFLITRLTAASCDSAVEHAKDSVAHGSTALSTM